MCDGFVRDQVRAREELVLRRRLVEKERRRVVINRAGVLHAAELKRRQQHEVELVERILAIRVGFEPLERLLMEIEDRLAVCRNFGGVGFAVVEVKCAAVAFAALDGELAGGEAKQVGRKRRRLAEPHGRRGRRMSRGRFRAHSRAPPMPPELRASATAMPLMSGWSKHGNA